MRPPDPEGVGTRALDLDKNNLDPSARFAGIMVLILIFIAVFTFLGSLILGIRMILSRRKSESERR